MKISKLEKQIKDSVKKNEQEKTNSNHRRKDFRLNIFNESVEVEVTLLSCDDEKFKQILGKKFTGKIIDISVSGLKIVSKYNFPIKGRFKVRTEFSLNKIPFKINAYLLRKEEHLKEKLISYGLQFVEMDRKTKEELTIILHKLESKRRKEIS